MESRNRMSERAPIHNEFCGQMVYVDTLTYSRSGGDKNNRTLSLSLSIGFILTEIERNLNTQTTKPQWGANRSGEKCEIHYCGEENWHQHTSYAVS